MEWTFVWIIEVVGAFFGVFVLDLICREEH
jgi:hypothetical protein